MGTLDDVKRMQQEGKSDKEIIIYLQQQRVPSEEIQEALTQSKIKQAVSSEDEYHQEQDTANFQMTRQFGQGAGLEPSLLGSESSNQEPLQPTPPQQEPAPAEQNYPQQYEQYSDYSSSGLNADTISEIAEQAVTQKIALIRNKLESVLDLKSILESKIDSVDERLKRIERTIDRLQLSILQKVGDYMSNVEDIKKELVETQQSFKSLLKNNQNENSPTKYKELA